ncbi:unnamed protein product [Cylindrotheca closterium]|uniref:Uncharacterized protein n=1 Tax=Cylindrotheca closterium TaxID=2856 RepID=A0AAD2CB71_9STRA|nr:unnamed protein product [Cylindrotheca closterium]
MGQGASKTASNTAKNVAKKVTESRPPIAAHQVQAPPPPKTTEFGTAITPQNPGGFMRGDGVGSQDVRDVGQEMYLRDKQKGAPQEMPEDLLKFITDVGPAKQEVDKDNTSKRLLEKENAGELEKIESQRTAPRQRIDMPLMGEDHDYSVSRNTNFTSRVEDTKPEFGMSNLQFYAMVREHEKDVDSGVVEVFYEKITEGIDTWDEKEQEAHKKKMSDALKYVCIPVLRVDTDGNILGLHPDRVPGPQAKSLQPISPSKAKLVLEDILESPPTTIERNRPPLE